MAILKNDEGLIQLHKCPKCEYLVVWSDTVNDEHLCKWCAAQPSVRADGSKREPTIIKSFPMRDAYPAGHKPRR